MDQPSSGLPSLERTPAQAVPEAVFTELAAGDILFVDTTHTVKIASDVNRIILRILPLLAPGVVVHFHDICLPYEYPRYLFEDYALYWAEQYLLQAFLSMNPSFEGRCMRPTPCAGTAARTSSGPGWLHRVRAEAHSGYDAARSMGLYCELADVRGGDRR